MAGVLYSDVPWEFLTWLDQWMGPANPVLRKAESLYHDGRWTEAEEAFASLSEQDTDNAMIWYRLGQSRQAQKKTDEALAAYERAAALPGMHGAEAAYDTARIHALAGETDLAFTWLGRAVEAAWKDTERMAKDEDLESLRTDPRWKEIVDLMENYPFRSRGK